MSERKKKGFQVEILERTTEKEHFHQSLEILYILEGSLTLTMENDSWNLEQEDIFLVNAGRKHRCDQASENLLFAQITIDYTMIMDILDKKNVIFWCDSARDDNSKYDELRKVLRQILNQHLNQKDRESFEYISRCYHFLSLLTVYFMIQASGKADDKYPMGQEDRIGIINNFIHTNYQKRITLGDLAKELYLSEGYLSRFFKKNYGMSFAAYLENIRVYHVVEELLHTDDAITEIAYRNGFANMTVFNKAFKAQHGMTPSAMRKELQQKEHYRKKSKEVIEAEQRLEKYLKSDGSKTDEYIRNLPEQQEFSVNISGKTAFAWNDTMNIGSAYDLLRSDVREHVILLQAALGFHYVRFWSLFSKQMFLNNSTSDEQYNFTQLDSVFDFLIQQGLKPHIELGNKPKRVNRTTDSGIFLEEEIEEQQRKCLEKRVDMMLRHCLHRYGKAEVDTWRIELWFNEKRWGESGANQEYFSQFSAIYHVVRKYSSSLVVGGCGIRTLTSENEIRDFLGQWKQQMVQPDFVSVLQYSYIVGNHLNKDNTRRSTDPEYMLHRISKIKKILEEVGMSKCPLYITEWNMSVSDRNYLNDSCYKGAWIVKNMIDCYGQSDVMAYFSGSDRVAEYYDSGQMLHGGGGLITKDGVLKPAGFAMEFLNRLYPYFIGKGENILVTTDGHDSYGILCHNLKMLGEEYYFIQENEVEKEKLWSYFEDRDGIHEKIRIAGAENGVYKIKFYRVNEESGSVVNIWKEMGYENELSRNDIKYIRRVCEPALVIEKVSVEDNLLELEIDLKANEIMFIRLRKLPE